MEEFKTKEIELFNQYKQGDKEAKKQLISSLTPLINSQVQKYTNSGLPPIAIKLEGQSLASQAIDTYDPNKAQLNTHVTNYLQKLSRFVTNYQNVGHIPEPRVLMIGKYKTIYANLEADKGREPTAVELADAMQVPLVEIDRLQSELRNDLSTTIVAEGDDSTGFYEFVSPTNATPASKEAIEFVYFDADPIDKKILEHTLGLHGMPVYNNKQVAAMLGLTEMDLKKHKVNLANEIKSLM